MKADATTLIKLPGAGTSETFMSPVRLLVITAISIFIAEAIVMLLIFTVKNQPIPMVVLIDSLLLILLTLPILYFTLLRPMALHIADRRSAELELLKTKTLLEKTFAGLSDAVFVVDSHTQGVITCNSAVARIFGYSPDEVIERRFSDLHRDHIDFDELPKVLHPECDPNGSLRSEFKMLRKDRSAFDTEMTTTEILDDSGLRTATVHVIRDITERKQAEEEINRRNRELAALNAIGATISGLFNLPEMWGALKQWFSEELGLPGGMIFLLEEGTQQLLLKAAWGFPESVLGFLDSVPASAFHDSKTLSQGKAVLTSDLHRADAFLASGLDISRPDWQSYLSLPLMAKEKVQGVIDLFGPSADYFSSAQINFLQAVGHGVGIALNNARLYEQVRSNQERLQYLSRRLVEIQENERRKIALELHDEAGQALTSLNYGLQLLRQEPIAPNILAARLTELSDAAEGLMSNLHRLAMNMRPTSLDHEGLVSALSQYLKSFDETGLSVHFKAVGLEDERMPEEIELTLYRIVQEALTNVIRHSQATNVDVLLEKRDERIIIVIEDNGVGFDPESIMKDDRLGMLGMQERAEIISGMLEVESSPGHGTTVVVEVPYACPTSIGR